MHLKYDRHQTNSIHEWMYIISYLYSLVCRCMNRCWCRFDRSGKPQNSWPPNNCQWFSHTACLDTHPHTGSRSPPLYPGRSHHADTEQRHSHQCSEKVSISSILLNLIEMYTYIMKWFLVMNDPFIYWMTLNNSKTNHAKFTSLRYNVLINTLIRCNIC